MLILIVSMNTHIVYFTFLSEYCLAVSESFSFLYVGGFSTRRFMQLIFVHVYASLCLYFENRGSQFMNLFVKNTASEANFNISPKLWCEAF